jgi:hypothetical protein
VSKDFALKIKSQPKFLTFLTILFLLILSFSISKSTFADPKLTKISIDVTVVATEGETKSLQLPVAQKSAPVISHTLTVDKENVTYIARQGAKEKRIRIPRCGVTEQVNIVITVEPWRDASIDFSNKCARVEQHNFISKKLLKSISNFDTCMSCDLNHLEVEIEKNVKAMFYLKYYWSFILQITLIFVMLLISKRYILQRKSLPKNQVAELVAGFTILILLVISINSAKVERQISSIELRSRELIGIDQPKFLEMESPKGAFIPGGTE